MIFQVKMRRIITQGFGEYFQLVSFKSASLTF